jgi:hypothetical protein
MKLSNKTYDIMKWVVQLLIPALITLYGVIGSTLNIPYTQEVLTIAGAVDVFLGTILKISTDNYNKENDTL